MRMQSWIGAVVIFVAACGAPVRGGPGGPGGDGGGQGGDGQGGGGAAGGAGGAGGGPGKPKGCGGGGTAAFKPSEFKPPVVQCKWDEGRHVMCTPMVMDADGDGVPEIFFISFGKRSGSDPMLHAISGEDCHTIWSADASGALVNAEIALGDLDGDGAPEVVVLRQTGLSVFNARTGKFIDGQDLDRMNANRWTALQIANLDGEGPAEIIAGSTVARLEGGKLKLVWNLVRPGVSLGAVADLDGDGKMEVIANEEILEGATGKVRLDLKDEALSAVAEFDPGSPGPEIVRVNSWLFRGGAVEVLAGLMAPVPGKKLFGPYYPPVEHKPYNGGAPAVADFDGDGTADIGVAFGDNYTVFARRCAADPRPADCAAPGVLWRKGSQDVSSAVTTSTVFDFNCDGKAEVVYRDECWLRVYDGSNGNVLFADARTSGTSIEGASVADTDGTGHAKIVIGTNDVDYGEYWSCPAKEEATGTDFSGRTRGVVVLKDPLDRWQQTRRVWNQNAYHVTNVEENGAIPLSEAPSWLAGNTYRANAGMKK